jgi:membrane fusion protein (multidrug efflux system)
MINIKPKLGPVLMGIIVIVILGGIGFYWRYSQKYPSTSNAYIQANVVYVSPQISGLVTKVSIKNFQQVTKGQSLFTIDQAPYLYALHKAKAELTLAKQSVSADEANVLAAEDGVKQKEAEFAEIKQNSQRIFALKQLKQASPAAGDKAKRDLLVAKASLHAAKNNLLKLQKALGITDATNASIESAKAAYNKAQFDFNNTHIIAAAEGQILNLTLRAGSYVQAGRQLFSLVESANWWITANFKETQLTRIKPGQAVSITIDMYPNKVFHGKVIQISRGSGSVFSILPPENATGNWVKVTQRFPVKISIDDQSTQYPLRMGASCDVTINTISS